MSPRAWAMGMTVIALASTAPAQQPAPPASPQAAPGAPGSAPSAAPAHPSDRHLTAQDRVEQRVGAMAKALKLNGDQQRQLRIILMDQLEQIQKIRNDPSIAPEDRIGALRALYPQTSNRIYGILDEEQRKKYSPPPAHPSEAHSTGS